MNEHEIWFALRIAMAPPRVLDLMAEAMRAGKYEEESVCLDAVARELAAAVVRREKELAATLTKDQP